MPSFSKTSKARLATCHKDLIMVFERVILIRDCTIIQGYRDRETHEMYLRDGKTKVPYELTKHGKDPSQAVDVAPWFAQPPHIRWNDWKSWYAFAGIVIGVAWTISVPIRWGGDWNRNWDFEDQTFHDLNHFEIMVT